MTFPILGGNGAVTGFSIDNSLRFNDDDSPQLSRTADAGNRKTFTLSFWIKRGNLGTSNPTVISSGINSSNDTRFAIRTDNGFIVRGMEGGGSIMNLQSSALFRDVSAWYHFVLAFDTTQSTASDRVKVYQNGVQVTDFGTADYPTQNRDLFFNHSSSTEKIGVLSYTNANYWDGYMAEFQSVDGQQLDASSFGEFDEDSGIWKPKRYSGSYGTNGFKLNFSNSGSLGADSSGNGNNFTPTNLASTDQTTDTPTNNFATMNPLAVTSAGTATFSEGNCQVATVVSGSMGGYCNINFPSSGKWYCEAKITTSSPSNAYIGVVEYSATDSNSFTNGDSTFYYGNGQKYVNGSASSYGSAWSQNDIIGMAVNGDDNQITFYLNGSSQGVLSETIEGKTWNAGDTNPSVSHTFQWNFGNPVHSISSGNSDGNGYGNFEYAPPSGYLALCTQNLATALSPTIDDGSQYFHTQLYTGDGQDNRTVTNDAYSGDFQPDFLWIKERSSTSAHRIFDSTRGASKRLEPNANLAEATDTSNHKSFDTDGFTLGTSGSTNANGDTYVAWQWKANGGTTSTNTDGSQNTTVQVNSTAGFSIVKRTGTGSAGATYGHGLGVVPEVIINKGLNTNEWYSYFKAIGGGSHWISLESSGASVSDANMWNNTDATSSVFTVGNSGGSNGSGVEYINYCFHSVEGYSKFGSYEGNAVADGTFVYTGFRPAWIMIKRYSGAGHDWIIIDTKRFTFNVIEDYLKANSSDAEIDTFSIDEDILSNGFKLRGTSTNINGGGSSYIYMAFAENPFVTSSGVPVTAR